MLQYICNNIQTSTSNFTYEEVTVFPYLQTHRRTDGRTDELIWAGLGNLWFLQVKHFLIAPYPPPLSGPYDYCATPDEEYDLMCDKVRNRLLKDDHLLLACG